MNEPVTLDISIEELVRRFPEAVGVLSRYGVRCIRCGEPLWCTLGELLKEDGVLEPEALITALNAFLSEPKMV
jgi:hypothetical protein